MLWRAIAEMQTWQNRGLTESAAGLLLALAIGITGLPDAAAAEIDDELEFARGVVKARLEVDRTGTSYRWSHPTSGNSGRLTIVETQISANNQPCRWYRWTMQVSGDDIAVDGKGCRMDNGDWLLEETAVVTKLRRVEVPVAQPSPAPAPAPEPESAPAPAESDPLESIDYTLPERSAAPAGSGTAQ